MQAGRAQESRGIPNRSRIEGCSCELTGRMIFRRGEEKLKTERQLLGSPALSGGQDFLSYPA